VEVHNGKGISFVVVMCPKKVGARACKRRNYCEDVKEWMPPPLFSLDF
jgi:hypothetical protein